MPFIYSRAQTVLVWLGCPKSSHFELSYRSHRAAQLCSIEYWTRVWIVQEIGLARKVSFFYECRDGTIIEEWEEFMSEVPYTSLLEDDDEKARLPLKLKKHREGRHGDMNKLEQLLETFAYTECREPRDKIYGFLGLAHDCHNGILKVDYSKSLFDLYKEVIAFQYNAKPLESPLPPNIDRMMRLVSFSNPVQRMQREKLMTKSN